MLSTSATDLHNYGAQTLTIGAYGGGGYDFWGYISNLRVVKGTALYTSNFTPPTNPLSAVTNTVLLCCQSSTDATDAAVTPGTITANGDASATLKTDTSSDNDSFVDSPTNGTQTDTGAGGEVAGNYATLNPLSKGSNVTLSNGNLDFASAIAYNSAFSTIGVTSGKWYMEATAGTFVNDFTIGISNDVAASTYVGGTAGSYGYEAVVGGKYNNTVGSSTGYSTYTTGDIVSVAFDADNGKVFFAKNGVWQESGNPATGVNPAYSGLTSGPYFFGCSAGAGGTFTGVNFGQRPFAYTAPSGYKALCTTSLSTPTIEDGSDYLDAVTYTGNGSTQSITGLGFSPDLVWLKSRSNTKHHSFFDSLRGTNLLYSSLTNAEQDYGTGNLSLNSDGFSITYNATFTAVTQNHNSDSCVAWAWDAGSSTVSNTDGTITSSVRVNTSAGFSVVTAGVGGYFDGTVGHGLGVAPDFIIMKDRNNTIGWRVYHSSMGNFKYGILSTTDAFPYYNNLWGVTSTTFGTDQNVQSTTAVAYCWSAVEGYSDFGSYIGNNSTDGPFVFTGFTPRWLLIKNATTAGGNWVIYDTARDSTNLNSKKLAANANYEENNTTNLGGDTAGVDFLSNGFKVRTTGANHNTNASTYIYAAFAEHPFKTARAR